jgi:hypothetical protein
MLWTPLLYSTCKFSKLLVLSWLFNKYAEMLSINFNEKLFRCDIKNCVIELNLMQHNHFFRWFMVNFDAIAIQQLPGSVSVHLQKLLKSDFIWVEVLRFRNKIRASFQESNYWRYAIFLLTDQFFFLQVRACFSFVPFKQSRN